MDDDVFRVWVTKHTLTSGGYIPAMDVIRIREDIVAPALGDFRRWAKCWLREGEWHLSAEAAVVHAEKLRQQKINKLEGWLLRATTMEFRTD